MTRLTKAQKDTLAKIASGEKTYYQSPGDRRFKIVQKLVKLGLVDGKYEYSPPEIYGGRTSIRNSGVGIFFQMKATDEGRALLGESVESLHEVFDKANPYEKKGDKYRFEVTTDKGWTFRYALSWEDADDWLEPKDLGFGEYSDVLTGYHYVYFEVTGKRSPSGRKIPMGMTDTMGIMSMKDPKASQRVFGTVIKIITDLAKKFNTDGIVFTATEKSRRKLYRTMSRRIGSKVGLKSVAEVDGGEELYFFITKHPIDLPDQLESRDTLLNRVGLFNPSKNLKLDPYNSIITIARAIPAKSIVRSGPNLVFEFRDQAGARLFMKYFQRGGQYYKAADRVFVDGDKVYLDYVFAKLHGQTRKRLKRTPLKTEATTTGNIATFMKPIGPPMTRSPLRWQGYEHGKTQKDLCKKCKKHGYICPECKVVKS